MGRAEGQEHRRRDRQWLLTAGGGAMLRDVQTRISGFGGSKGPLFRSFSRHSQISKGALVEEGWRRGGARKRRRRTGLYGKSERSCSHTIRKRWRCPYVVTLRRRGRAVLTQDVYQRQSAAFAQLSYQNSKLPHRYTLTLNDTEHTTPPCHHFPPYKSFSTIFLQIG